MYDRIWTGFDLWRSLLAVSPDKADRTSDFFFGKTAAKCGGKITEKTDCGRGNSVAPGDFDQYRDSMSDAVGGREDPSWCYQILAARSLSVESKKVYHALKTQDVEGARKAVSMIVGRDTKSLTEEGIAKAAVETVAENTSDGVTAPLMFLMLGGAPLGFLYKAVNTMDSMLGYKNEKNLYFGRVAAKMDDVFNYLPSRVSAVLMIAAAFLTGMDAKKAAQIYKRDRRKHASPNSAQTESVCAGALQVQLAGDAWYFGVLHKKETIGDPIRPVEAEDIKRAGRLMYVTAVLTLLFAGMIRFWYFW